MPAGAQSVFLDRMIGTLGVRRASSPARASFYSVLAYTVAQREIGLRMALGADSRLVKSMVLRRVADMTVIGVSSAPAARSPAG